MTSKNKKAVTGEALKTSKQAYLAYLFLLMADDERYSKVKATLDNNYLLGKQEYPQDLLAAKRLLADFKGTSKPKKRGEVARETPPASRLPRRRSHGRPSAMGAGAAAPEGGGSARTSRKSTARRSRNWTRRGTSSAATAAARRAR